MRVVDAAIYDTFETRLSLEHSFLAMESTRFSNFKTFGEPMFMERRCRINNDDCLLARERSSDCKNVGNREASQ